jgi:hypothetical protein
MNIQMMIFLLHSRTHEKVSENFRRSKQCPLTYYQELREVFGLSCDFGHVPICDFLRAEHPGSGPDYYMADCKCRMELFGDSLSVHIIWDGVEMCSTEIKVI